MSSIKKPNAPYYLKGILDIKMRMCLGGCDKKFKSTWNGHRICNKCKQRLGIERTREPERAKLTSNKIYIE